jgi:NADP-dependent 3-hydroxy acid dehydrogenase YdfG
MPKLVDHLNVDELGMMIDGNIKGVLNGFCKSGWA